MRAFGGVLCKELQAARDEVQSSCVRLDALNNSPREFQKFFGGFVVLSKVVGDKIFLAMSNISFFNKSRDMQVDFSDVFHLVYVPDFEDVFPVLAAFAQHRYLRPSFFFSQPWSCGVHQCNIFYYKFNFYFTFPC